MVLQRERWQPERGQLGVVAYQAELQDKQYSLRFGESAAAMAALLLHVHGRGRLEAAVDVGSRHMPDAALPLPPSLFSFSPAAIT